MAGEVGADISYFQSFNASQYNEPFIFIRATFGTSLVDPQFATFRAAARAKPIPFRAYYHFLVANVPAQTQFNFFEAQVGNLQQGENVMIDDESYAATGGLPSRAIASEFAQLCKNRWGVWPIHYSLESTGRLGSCPQTFASYSSSNPGSEFWQYSDGTYNYTSMPKSAGGIGNCDMNLCNTVLASCFIPAGTTASKAPATPTPAAKIGFSGGGDMLVGVRHRPGVGLAGSGVDVAYVQPSTNKVLHAWGSAMGELSQESLGGWADPRFGVGLDWAPDGNSLVVTCVGSDGALYKIAWVSGKWGPWMVVGTGKTNVAIKPMVP